MFDLTVANGLLPPNSDKVELPASALTRLVDLFGDTLPHPLIFSVKAAQRQWSVGVKQFTAEEGTVVLPDAIRHKLGVASGDVVTLEPVDVAKGTFLKIKPVQFYPEIHNWKYYLESNLTKYYTVLTKGDKLVLNGYELIIEDLNAPVVSIIDTDLVLDVVPLNDIMAHQQLNFSFDTSEEMGYGTKTLVVDPFRDNKVQVFRFDVFQADQDLEVSIESSDACNVDLVVGYDQLVSLDNFKFSTLDQDFGSEGHKSVVVPFSEIQQRADACRHDMDQGFDMDDVNHWLYVVPFAWEKRQEVTLRVERKILGEGEGQEKEKEEKGQEQGRQGSLQCPNCRKPIATAQFQLHEAFCVKNNVRCECGAIFLRSIPPDHWHCPQCLQYSSSPLFRFKHEKMNHQSFTCDKCSSGETFSTFIDLVIHHKSTVCPAKLHECKFCHLVLEQGVEDYIDRFENLTHHENECGNKTDECPKCHKNVKRKDFRKHFKLHQLDTQTSLQQFKEMFQKCTNVNCTNPAANTNQFQLCEQCFGPLYSQLHDPKLLKLQMRLERRYMLQLNKGCEFNSCQNEFCKRNLVQPFSSIKEVLKVVHQDLLIHVPFIPHNNGDHCVPTFWFCVSDNITNKMALYQQYSQDHAPELVLKGLNELREVSSESLALWLKEN